MAYNYQPIQRSQEPSSTPRALVPMGAVRFCVPEMHGGCQCQAMPSSKTRGACQHLVDHYLSLYTPSECSHCAQLLPVPIAKHLCRLKRGPNSQCKGKLACHFSVIGTQ